jgi:hypothetical protein
MMGGVTRAAARAISLALCNAAACGFFDPLDQDGLRVLMAPPDTALYVGAQFHAHGMMRNSYGDVYPSEHLTYSGLDPAVMVWRSGTVTGVTYGRARVTVMREHLADTGWVSVVPSGTLAISSHSTVDVANVDGSAFRTLASAGQGGGGAPTWLPGTAGLVYHYAIPGGAGARQLFVTDLTGSSRPLVSGEYPRAARDGSWVYFQNGSAIWRVRLDGSGLEQLSPVGTNVPYGHPDPSPDGTELVAIRGRFPFEGTFDVIVRDLAAGSERAVGVAGLFPRWSPDGGQIAYWSGDPFAGRRGTIAVVNADGTANHQVSAAGRFYDARGPDWSPDGQWLIARSDSTLDLVEVATGLTLPLGYVAGHLDASWRW